METIEIERIKKAVTSEQKEEPKEPQRYSVRMSMLQECCNTGRLLCKAFNISGGMANSHIIHARALGYSDIKTNLTKDLAETLADRGNETFATSNCIKSIAGCEFAAIPANE